jgi:DNA polymerase I
MQIELRKGLALQPGTFNAVIAPEKMMINALNSNADLQRFLFLYIGGNYSRILSGINRQSKNFDVRRGFTAHQLLTTLREAGHTVVFVEHDPTLFDGAMDVIEPVAGALKDAGRESLVILYTPVVDRTFSALTRRADRYIEIVAVETDINPIRTTRIMRQYGQRPKGQRTLEVS